MLTTSSRSLTRIHQCLLKSLGLYCRAVCITRNFSEPQNPRFIIESGFKSRAGYAGTRTVHTFFHSNSAWVFESVSTNLCSNLSMDEDSLKSMASIEVVATKGTAVKGMFMECKNTIKSLYNLWQCYLCTLDQNDNLTNWP